MRKKIFIWQVAMFLLMPFEISSRAKCTIENLSNCTLSSFRENFPKDKLTKQYANKLTILHLLAFTDREDLVTYVLNESPALVNAQDTWQCTPIFIALSKSQYAVARLLVKFGASVHHRDAQGDNLLMNLSEHGSLAEFKYYIEILGVNPKNKGKDGRTVADFINQADPERMKIYKYLRSKIDSK